MLTQPLRKGELIRIFLLDLLGCFVVDFIDCEVLCQVFSDVLDYTAHVDGFRTT